MDVITILSIAILVITVGMVLVGLLTYALKLKARRKISVKVTLPVAVKTVEPIFLTRYRPQKSAGDSSLSDDLSQS